METDDGFSPAVWERIAGELALPAIGIPEAHGGAGFGAVERGIALEECGRSLVCAPLFATSVLAANAILKTPPRTLSRRACSLLSLPGRCARRLRFRNPGVPVGRDRSYRGGPDQHRRHVGNLGPQAVRDRRRQRSPAPGCRTRARHAR